MEECPLRGQFLPARSAQFQKGESQYLQRMSEDGSTLIYRPNGEGKFLLELAAESQKTRSRQFEYSLRQKRIWRDEMYLTQPRGFTRKRTNSWLAGKFLTTSRRVMSCT
ncbi:hypothetical protein TB2_046198 [Malus domestica]